MRLSLMQKGFLLVSIPLCFEIGIFSLLINLQSGMAKETERINNARIISNSVNHITHEALDLDDVFKKGQNPMVTANMIQAGTKNLIAQFSELEIQTRNDKILHDNVLYSLKELGDAKQKLQDLRTFILTHPENDPIEAAKRYAPEFHDSLRRVVSRGLLELATRTAATIDTDRTEAVRLQTIFLLKTAVAISACIALLSAWLFSRNLTSRLKIVVNNAERMGERQPLLPPLGGSDELAELDTAVHQADNLINHLEQFREEIIGMVGHDIRSPLASIKVTGEALEDRLGDALDDRGRQLLQEIDANCDRILRISRDLLDMQRLESGMLIIDKTKCDLRDCLQSAVASVSGMCHNRKVTIQLTAASQPAHVDEGRIEQVVTNLLTNAIKHSPKNGVVELAMEPDRKRQQVRISVRDYGKGIAPHMQKEIFERFKQAGKEEFGQGTGLGLAISKALVELHEGQIGVESLTPDGTEFFIVLPLS